MRSRPALITLVATAMAGGIGCQGNSVVSQGNTTKAVGASGSGSAGSAGSAGGNGAAGSGNGATTGSGSGNGNATGSNGSGPTTGSCVDLQCQVQQCPNGGHTYVSGIIMDPAGQNPLYNVAAYVPNSIDDVQALVPGASCSSCSSLFTGDPVAAGLSSDVGVFTITDPPSGNNIPLVVQVGKWRTHITLDTVTPCTGNDAGSIALPSMMDPNDPIINLPDIAVSTGGADSLECLLVRVGIDQSEFVAGNDPGGKVHIFNGGDMNGGGKQGIGQPETNLMPGAPASYTDLWGQPSQLSANDIVLLSCEGGETYNANPSYLEGYLNGGGRVFASHYHYAWFSGPTDTKQGYSSPSDWGIDGSDLALWYSGSGVGPSDDTDGDMVTTLSSGGTFYKGQAMSDWLTDVSALGTGNAKNNQLYILEPRENAVVSPLNTPSQAWITDPKSNGTLFFSFDTPLGGVIQPGGADAGAPQYCGRAVFSGLHVGGASYDGVNCTDNRSGGNQTGDCNPNHIAYAAPPAGCDNTHPLSPQEKALEFMLFDLSSCVVADNVNPADAGSGPSLR